MFTQKSFVACLSLFVLACLLVACAPATEEHAEHPHWAYAGEGGPEHWGELDEAYEACAIGLEQSPIDLNNADLEDLGNIAFHYQPSQVNILNNGHTIQVNYDEGSYIEVNGERYNLLQFHFHMPSEHTVAGLSYAGELHLVHQNAAGALAVVGIFLDSGVENLALAPVWANLPEHESEVEATGDTVDAAAFLPADQQTFRYPGSLTTPPCSEGVSWFVMAEPVQLAPSQVDQFGAIISANNRPVQPLGERELSEDSTP
jgi:carbonic anhydrase